ETRTWLTASTAGSVSRLSIASDRRRQRRACPRPRLARERPRRGRLGTLRAMKCAQCHAEGPLPEALLAEPLAAVGTLLRSGDKIRAIRELRARLGIGLAEAKAIEQHVTRVKGSCHRCSAALEPSVVSACPRCGALNLDW